MVDFKISGIKRRFLNQRSSVSSTLTTASSSNYKLNTAPSESAPSSPTSPISTRTDKEPAAKNDDDPSERPLTSYTQESTDDTPQNSTPIVTMPPPGPRKVWVKRSGASPTLVLLNPDHLVDEAKELILRRYQNSLGRQFDAPDVTLRLIPRNGNIEQTLSPDELLWEILDKTYPGGQKMDEALIIHVPQKRTPRHSPLPHGNHYSQAHQQYDDSRPHENGTDYFPPMPQMPLHLPSSPGGLDPRYIAPDQPRAMTVITTGQVPPLISPGGTRRAHGSSSRQGRPTFARHSTASPTTHPQQSGPNGTAIAANSSRPSRPRVDSVASEKHATTSATTPPTILNTQATPASTATPKLSPRLSSPRPSGLKAKRPRKPIHASTMSTSVPGASDLAQSLSLSASFIDTPVPPINILIVEDNIINMKLLEQFVRRLKVHWATAVNGKEAVEKWRQGGFHLVLMDIQLPIMSGLEATREIRRLERVNGVGVFSHSAHSSVPPEWPETAEEMETRENEHIVKPEDQLKEKERLFKSSVIIVALTASNLQSDRHEALAAGCNDFLTKPVNFAWFERKVKEWGCMQALIDFDGWRKWKDAAEQNGLKDANSIEPKYGSFRRKLPIRRIAEESPTSASSLPPSSPQTIPENESTTGSSDQNTPRASTHTLAIHSAPATQQTFADKENGSSHGGVNGSAVASEASREPKR